jgi:hypothetical protein
VRELSFPALSPDFVERVTRWHAAARRWLEDGAPAAPISAQMRSLLRAALGDPGAAPDTLALTRPLRVAPFPTEVSVLAILLWRARLVYFLADVWDVIGPPLLEMEESEWVIQELLTPPSNVELCLDCLQPIPAARDLAARHLDECELRRARFNSYGRV